ncbi:MAG TPA: ABC transporter ATP-binding protein [Acidimicrobiia bacterium]|nr:ABC transporter ATP-binding protein [Acidimicrobiia bacterium]
MSLTAHSVRHRYSPAGPPVLDGVDFEVETGSSVALTGPSGSGKSTFLAILGGLTQPTHGEVMVDGQPVVRLSSTFGWVFQANNALGRRTALDNVTLPLLARGAERRSVEPEACHLLELVGLGTRIEAVARSLSGGELQRVCIARAMATQPSVVLADEPTGQLDATTSGLVLDALWAALPGSTTLVVATHDQTVASRCDRVVQISDGKLVE